MYGHVFTEKYIYFEAVGQLFRVNLKTNQVDFKEYEKWYPMKENI